MNESIAPAAIILVRRQEGVSLEGLTELSDAAARSLSGIDAANLDIWPDSEISSSAAQILRDAGHGE